VFAVESANAAVPIQMEMISVINRFCRERISEFIIYRSYICSSVDFRDVFLDADGYDIVEFFS
jgi:hypothetical protein